MMINDWKDWCKNVSEYPEVQQHLENALERLIDSFFVNSSEYNREKFVKSFSEKFIYLEKNMKLNRGIAPSQIEKLISNPLEWEKKKKEYINLVKEIKNSMFSEINREVRHYYTFLPSVIIGNTEDSIKENESEDDIVKATTIDEAVQKVMDIYSNEEVCIDELLDSIQIVGLSVNEVFEVYTELFKTIENEVVKRVRAEEM